MSKESLLIKSNFLHLRNENQIDPIFQEPKV